MPTIVRSNLIWGMRSCFLPTRRYWSGTQCWFRMFAESILSTSNGWGHLHEIPSKPAALASSCPHPGHAELESENGSREMSKIVFLAKLWLKCRHASYTFLTLHEQSCAYGGMGILVSTSSTDLIRVICVIRNCSRVASVLSAFLVYHRSLKIKSGQRIMTRCVSSHSGSAVTKNHISHIASDKHQGQVTAVTVASYIWAKLK